jgi:CDP-glucose 4,6-dehydratase
MKLSRELWEGRRVLVTGHTGFKGSWLTLLLSELGARASGYALAPSTTPSHFALASVETRLQRHTIADLRDLDELGAAIDAADPEIVLHLAAQPLVRASYEAPLETFQTNVLGTANLLEVVRRRARPCAIVVVTSDKAYENTGQLWGYRECDPMGGHDPYSASKGAAELVVASYRRSFFADARLGVRVASARAGNVIGGGDFARDRIVVDVVRALSQARPVQVRNPDAVRPWQHVLEPLTGYLLLAERLFASPDDVWCSAWNFGPRAGDELPVGELVKRLCSTWGSGEWVAAKQPGAVHEAHQLRLSTEKARVLLGFEPRWTIEETIARTARWYRRWSEQRADLLQATLDDIRAYFAAV